MIDELKKILDAVVRSQQITGDELVLVDDEERLVSLEDWLRELIDE